jgi:uncharacterized membrane protein YkoI
MSEKLSCLALATVSVLGLGGISFAQNAPVASPAFTDGQAIGLAAAIKAAQSRVQGGILEAELETEAGRRVYEVDVASNGQVREVKVDALTGEVLAMEDQPLSGAWKRWFDRDELRAAEAAGGSIVQALSGLPGGHQATEAELEEKGGRWVYKVEIATGTGENEVLLDATTGQALAR